ncbi:N-acetylmuramoyl-L-alanine amidase [Streptomyces violaceus]|uniref:peptidoglycan recognition protein family protein n=1 Tax=Streptomyces violaceus TaxID=1936 RepID=UPI0037F22F07
MSTPLTARTFQTLVKRSGIPHTFYDGWQTLNRGQRGDGWGSTDENPGGVNGVMVHHTVTRDVAATIRLVREVGQPENNVPPPLYPLVVDKRGHLHVAAWGRCNHAGLGDDDVHRAVVAERYPLPAPNELNVDGNARYYGVAGINMGDGVDPWPHSQLNTIAGVSALLCDAHNWTERSVIGHLEWQRGKPDPRATGGGSLMPRIRQLVNGRL